MTRDVTHTHRAKSTATRLAGRAQDVSPRALPLLNITNSENQAVNTPLSEQKPAKFEKSRLATGSLLDLAQCSYYVLTSPNRHNPD